ncbi:M23 family metallopeptidase [Amycolatopsis sp.]|uniref:M23 family metallopeptidase n=1 Tax=Amycolatopsis sp. TaxID=37632 RepID=UPI0039C8949A
MCSAHRKWEIDFNRGSTDDADLGDTVVAAAAGKVATSAHQGSENGYGNLVKIDHGGVQGQKIGELGNTSKPGNGISPHPHFEVRTTDTTLLYNATTGKNCVTTVKTTSLGTGSFSYYAGPVSASAADKCVKWGGSAGVSKFDSEFSHCS